MTRESRSDSGRANGEAVSSEVPEASKTTTGTSENASGETASGEARSDSGTSSGERGESRDDEIPLNITGHEDRERPGETAPGGDEDPDSANESGDSILEFTDVETDAGDDETGDDEEVEPVELLVQLAEDGEIDPWDIDVVRVTDKFLEAIEDADLRTSGRALFYASVLLRMKSDELFATDEPDEEELPPWEAPFADDGAMAAEEGGQEYPPGYDPIENLEEEMERRLERKHARGKPETLDELVRELRTAERDTWWKESRTYDTSDSPKGYDRGVQELNYHSGDDFRVDDEPTSDDVTHTTHDEDIESVIDDVEAELERHYEQGRDEVLYAEIDELGGTRVMTYLALLFLAHRGRVTLEQDELFGDLWVQGVTVESEASEAIAD